MANVVGNWTITFSVHDPIGALATQTQVVSVSQGKPWITAVADNANNRVNLSWGMDPASSTSLYNYTVYERRGTSGTYSPVLNSGTSGISPTAKDVNGPNSVSRLVAIQNGSKIKATFIKPSDIGTYYEFYVHATGISAGDEMDSLITSAEVKTGIRGYAYVVDTNPNTDPGNTVNLTSEVLEYTVSDPSKNYYVHIKAIDNAGNASDVVHSMPIKIEAFTDRVTAANAWMDAEIANGTLTEDKAKELNRYFMNSEVVCKLRINPQGNNVQKYHIKLVPNDNNSKIGIKYIKVVKIAVGNTVKASENPPMLTGTQIGDSLCQNIDKNKIEFYINLNDYSSPQTPNPQNQPVDIYFKFKFYKSDPNVILNTEELKQFTSKVTVIPELFNSQYDCMEKELIIRTRGEAVPILM